MTKNSNKRTIIAKRVFCWIGTFLEFFSLIAGSRCICGGVFEMICHILIIKYDLHENHLYATLWMISENVHLTFAQNVLPESFNVQDVVHVYFYVVRPCARLNQSCCLRELIRIFTWWVTDEKAKVLRKQFASTVVSFQ